MFKQLETAAGGCPFGLLLYVSGGAFAFYYMVLEEHFITFVTDPVDRFAGFDYTHGWHILVPNRNRKQSTTLPMLDTISRGAVA